MSALASSDFAGLLESLSKMIGMRICIGNRWRCPDGHEWISVHCDAAWFRMPTTCRECGKQAIEHRGEWMVLGDCLVEKQE